MSGLAGVVEGSPVLGITEDVCSLDVVGLIVVIAVVLVVLVVGCVDQISLVTLELLVSLSLDLLRVVDGDFVAGDTLLFRVEIFVAFTLLACRDPVCGHSSASLDATLP